MYGCVVPRIEFVDHAGQELRQVLEDGGHPWEEGTRPPQIAVLDPLNADIMNITVGEQKHIVAVDILPGEGDWELCASKPIPFACTMRSSTLAWIKSDPYGRGRRRNGFSCIICAMVRSKTFA